MVTVSLYIDSPAFNAEKGEISLFELKLFTTPSVPCKGRESPNECNLCPLIAPIS
jgi:hypothetical protein